MMKALLRGSEVINCLVTEMHREEWLKLSVEEMYDELQRELGTIQSDILNNLFTQELHIRSQCFIKIYND